jgi:hypothetical protein
MMNVDGPTGSRQQLSKAARRPGGAKEGFSNRNQLYVVSRSKDMAS